MDPTGSHAGLKASVDSYCVVQMAFTQNRFEQLAAPATPLSMSVVWHGSFRDGSSRTLRSR